MSLKERRSLNRSMSRGIVPERDAGPDAVLMAGVELSRVARYDSSVRPCAPCATLSSRKATQAARAAVICSAKAGIFKLVNRDEN